MKKISQKYRIKFKKFFFELRFQINQIQKIFKNKRNLLLSH